MSKSAMVVCPGSFQRPMAATTYRQSRAQCPRCKRNIALRSDLTLYRHAPSISRTSREWQWRKRAEQTQYSMNWQPSGSLILCLRWFFELMGGAEALEEFKDQDSPVAPLDSRQVG